MPAHSTTTPVGYEIIVLGHLEAQWADWFDGLTLENQPDGSGRLACALTDQAALRGLLERIFDLNIELVSIRRIEDRGGNQ